MLNRVLAPFLLTASFLSVLPPLEKTTAFLPLEETAGHSRRYSLPHSLAHPSPTAADVLMTNIIDGNHFALYIFWVVVRDNLTQKPIIMKNTTIFLLSLLVLTSCVSKKQFLDMQGMRDEARLENQRLTTNLQACEQQTTTLQDQLLTTQAKLRVAEDQLVTMEAQLQAENTKVRSLEQQLEYFKATNTNLLDRLADLSIVSKTGAESIQKSLEALNQQNKYIQDLTTSMQRKDSLNLVLVMNLKRSLADFDDDDVTVEVKKGVVYISLSDKMLFRSGSAEINPRAVDVLGKIAKIVKDHQELDILVEGHTDNVPIRTECMEDNWDLSVKRATSVVRLLQWRYEVTPSRMTAAGRSEFIPKATNETAEGRSLNRRTEIIILPKLDQFFQLLEQPMADAGLEGK